MIERMVALLCAAAMCGLCTGVAPWNGADHAPTILTSERAEAQVSQTTAVWLSESNAPAVTTAAAGATVGTAATIVATLADTDGDGTPDGEDEAPFDNTYTGTLTTEYATSTVSFAMDYSWFFGDNTVYNPALSKVSILFSSVAYAENSLSLSDALAVRKTAGTTVAELLSYFGMQNPQTYPLGDYYDDIHLSEVTVGYHTVVVGFELKTVLAVIIRGTDKTLEEWSSNCDIGDLTNNTADDEWVNTLNHKGFDIAAARIRRFIEQYLAENNLHKDALVYWVTGHSRGAAIANIIGAELEQDGRTAFTYTFAAPNTTLDADAASYTSIFNIVNNDDFVPRMPNDVWGYTRYGVSTSNVSIKDSFEAAWESFTGIFDYNPPGNIDAHVQTLSGILTAGADPRVDCYQYTCSCHGDGSNDTVTITNTGVSESSREKAIAKIPSNALPYCIITRYDGGALGGWDFDVCQTPAYFMQLLAAFMGKEIDAYRFTVELNIADRYEDAKSALIAVGISGVQHPHYTETYYVLADNITADHFG